MLTAFFAKGRILKMKKFAVLFILLFIMNIIFANDVQQPNRQPVDMEISVRTVDASGDREAPVITFEVDPIVITPATYYDYMLGGYNGSTLKMQPETADPYGYPADGFYHSFMYQATAGAQRRVYYTYVDASYNVSTPAAISSSTIREGFPTVSMDPLTGNPFVVWHSSVDADNELESNMSYDMYNVVGGPGLWKQPFSVFFAPTPGFEQYVEIIWPVIQIGPSPEDGMRRVHVYGNYSPPAGSAMYNSLYGYSDFQYDDANFDMLLTDWTYQTFPQFDYWQDGLIKRAIKDMAVSDDGQVAFIGHANDSLFIYHSVDYGETFDLTMDGAHWSVFNPQNEDGSHVFENGDGSPGDVFIEPNGDGGHYNAIFTDNNTKVVYMTAFGINTVETQSNGQYYPAHFHPKIVYYDLTAGEFDFVDLQFTGLDAYDDQPMISYDQNEDGIPDSWDPDGNVEFANIWPSFWVSDFQSGAFHYSNFKLAKNEEKGWVIAVFQDGRYAWEAYWETPGYEDWAETSQIAISVSIDNGETWSEPAYMNAKADDDNYFEELDGMLPAYVYPCDYIEIIDETHGRVPVIFFDDYSYGSFYPNNHGQPTGGAQMFTVLNIEFLADSAEGSDLPPVVKLSQNYPNPFNPETTIDYSVLEAGNVSIDIYNIKGQLVKTLINDYRNNGEYSVIWDGTDDNDRSVSSGVYYYRMRTKNDSDTKKMVLMK